MVTGFDLPGNAERIAEEAVALLTAKPCPSGVTTVILDVEPGGLAGPRKLRPRHRAGPRRSAPRRPSPAPASSPPTSSARFRYGSELVNITADGTHARAASGTFGCDDEGVPAQRVAGHRATGLFVGYLTDRETAAQIGRTSGGACARRRLEPHPADPHDQRQPGARRVARFDDLIGGTDDGIYFGTNRSWSIDDHRLNFQFGTEIAWEIKDGKLGAHAQERHLHRHHAAVLGLLRRRRPARGWELWGTPNCGKGEPMQVAHVGHGAAAARFRNVHVGVV